MPDKLAKRVGEAQSPSSVFANRDGERYLGTRLNLLHRDASPQK